MVKGRSRKITISLAGLAVVCLFLLGIIYWQERQDKNLRVIFFDVGQGDSVLIRTPSRQNILIDGGPDTTLLSKLGRSLPFYDHTIDLMVLTHAHADHLDGLIPVLERYDVQQVLYNGVQTAAADFTAWQDLIQDKHISTTIARAGQSFQFGTTMLEVLYPFEDVSNQAFNDLNDSSVVTKLKYQNTTFLFTGDAPVGVEEEMLDFYCQAEARASADPCELESDVLKVGHHGSRYSTSEEFLEAVNPQYAVISAGEGNQFGHPHRQTLVRLQQVGATVLRTDEVGNIGFVSDGYRVWPIK